MESIRRNVDVFDYYERLQRVRSYVEEYYSEEITLEKAAGIANLERTYFSAFFKKKVGVPFTQWLRQYRVKKAMELFQQRDHLVTRVAYEVGFEDLRTFERAFKKHTNLTPIEYKKSVQV